MIQILPDVWLAPATVAKIMEVEIEEEMWYDIGASLTRNKPEKSAFRSEPKGVFLFKMTVSTEDEEWEHLFRDRNDSRQWGAKISKYVAIASGQKDLADMDPP